MKNFLKLLIIFLVPSLAFAQSNFKPGYVVNLKGDTLHGFIDYREWDDNPEVIAFKKSTGDKEITRYGPNDISYFNVNDLEYFKRYSGPISTDPTKENQVNNGKDSSFRTSAVFLKVLEQGKRLTLFKYQDELKLRFFVSEGLNDVPKELIFRTYIDLETSSRPDAHASKYVTENIFRKQLSAYAVRYNELNESLTTYIAKSDYAKDDMLYIVSKINHISKEELKRNESKGGPPFNLFVGAGLYMNNISSSSGSSYSLAGGGSKVSYGPMLSFGANFFANPATRKLQLRLELTGAQNKYKSLYKMKVSPYLPTEASFSEMAFSLSPQVIYNIYNAENFKVFVGGGLVLSMYKFSDPYLGTQNHDGAEAGIEAANPYFFNTTDNGFIFKAGVQLNKYLAIFGSYQSKVAVTKGGYFELSSAPAQVGVNVFFK